MKTRRITSAKVSLMQLRSLRHACAGVYCDKSFAGDELPEGWRSLQLFWAPNMGTTDLLELMRPPAIWDRDCVLCPVCARTVESLLKDIGNRLKETQGSA